jgi:orotate phosphoribosyltransferase
VSDQQEVRNELLTDLRHFGYQSGEVTLANGETSEWYVDAAQVLLRGHRLDAYRRVFKTVLNELPTFTAVGGLTMGADPMSFLIADVSNTRAFSIRRIAKGHGGESEHVVGPLRTDDQILIVDDVTTSGSSFQQTLQALEGCNIVAALCLVDRSEGAVPRLFSDRQILYYPMFTSKDFG